MRLNRIILSLLAFLIGSLSVAWALDAPRFSLKKSYLQCSTTVRTAPNDYYYYAQIQWNSVSGGTYSLERNDCGNGAWTQIPSNTFFKSNVYRINGSDTATKRDACYRINVTTSNGGTSDYSTILRVNNPTRTISNCGDPDGKINFISYQDIGLRVRENNQTKKIAVYTPGYGSGDLLQSPMIRKNGSNYEIVLVDPSDPLSLKTGMTASVNMAADNDPDNYVQKTMKFREYSTNSCQGVVCADKCGDANGNFGTGTGYTTTYTGQCIEGTVPPNNCLYSPGDTCPNGCVIVDGAAQCCAAPTDSTITNLASGNICGTMTCNTGYKCKTNFIPNSSCPSTYECSYVAPASCPAYPGCEAPSIVINDRLWSACNVGAIKPSDPGTFNVGKANPDDFNYVSGCPSGWHVATDADWQNAINTNKLAVLNLPKAGGFSMDLLRNYGNWVNSYAGHAAYISAKTPGSTYNVDEYRLYNSNAMMLDDHVQREFAELGGDEGTAESYYAYTNFKGSIRCVSDTAGTGCCGNGICDAGETITNCADCTCSAGYINPATACPIGYINQGNCPNGYYKSSTN